MSRKKHSVKPIIGKPREADVRRARARPTAGRHVRRERLGKTGYEDRAGIRPAQRRTKAGAGKTKAKRLA